MRILCSLRKQPARQRTLLTKMLWTAVCSAPPLLACSYAQAQFQPTLPNLGVNTVYNAGVSNSAIGTSNTLVAGTGSTIATNNTAVINDYIAYASSHGGGTVIIPIGTFVSNEILLKNEVNLDILSGATLTNNTPSSTFVSTASGTTGNVEISGGGVLNGNATTTSSNNMISLQGLSDILVNGVSINNASHEHLVPENDTNVTINAVTINDARSIANTDGIDYSGTNFLIENCTLNDGDDDIVAKPQSTACANILIQNCYITAGHGISIGGETNDGLTNMTVNNITFNAANATSQSNGLRLKAGRGIGGNVTNVTYNDITMINVEVPIQISSWYNGSGDTYPSPGPANAVNMAINSTSNTPMWSNITFSNINSTGSTSTISIYGVPEAPVQNVTFNNVTLDSGNGSKVQVNYAGYNGAFNSTANPAYEVLMNNTTINGTLLMSQADLTNSALFTQSPNGLYDADIVISNVVPEPTSGFLLVGGLALMTRRRRPDAPRAQCD